MPTLVLPPPQAARTRANTEHTASNIIDLARRGEAVNTEVFMLSVFGSDLKVV